MTDARVSRAGRARSALAEFLLIVAGVSVALAAESLWSARQDSILEAEYLKQLSSDLEENRLRLLAAVRDEEMIGTAALTALTAIRSGEAVSADSARAWSQERRGLYYSDPRLLTGTFSGLVDSGDLHLIRDPQIRKAVLAYPPQISQDKAEFDRWVDTYIQILKPYRKVALEADVYRAELGESGVVALTGNPVDPLMLEVLDGQIWTNQVRLIYLRRMLEATEDARAALGSGGQTAPAVGS